MTSSILFHLLFVPFLFIFTTVYIIFDLVYNVGEMLLLSIWSLLTLPSRIYPLATNIANDLLDGEE